MPKKNHPKPYAKYPPNVRRMLMRRDAEIERLSEMLHAERGGADAAIAHLKARLAKLMRETAQVTHASEPLPQVETKAGPTWVGVTKKVAASDPDPATEVVRATLKPWRLVAGGWCDWDGERYDHPARDEGTHVLALPTMPGMTLGLGLFRTFTVCPMWQWLRRNPTVFTPAVADSPWPGVMYRNSIDAGGATPLGGTVFRATDGFGDWMMMARPCHNPKWEMLSFYPLPPATWRAA